MSNPILIDLSQQLAQALNKAEQKLVTAESCTGGGLAELLTRLPGSSLWYERGFVTYSNEAKMELLNIQHETLLNHGAVSEETAAEMVSGAIKNSHAQYGVSITGIAGPDGGTEEKPIGTVCFGWCDSHNTIKTTKVQFDGDRISVREQACCLAIQGLLDSLDKK